MRNWTTTSLIVNEDVEPIPSPVSELSTAHSVYDPNEEVGEWESSEKTPPAQWKGHRAKMGSMKMARRIDSDDDDGQNPDQHSRWQLRDHQAGGTQGSGRATMWSLMRSWPSPS